MAFASTKDITQISRVKFLHKEIKSNDPKMFKIKTHLFNNKTLDNTNYLDKQFHCIYDIIFIKTITDNNKYKAVQNFL